MQIFSQYFPLFVVGFSFRFLNNKKVNNFAAAAAAVERQQYVANVAGAAG